jgi:hypothetical protein
MEKPELILFKNTVRRMQPLLGELVFAGGCATAVFCSDPDFERAHPAQWLDVISNHKGEVGYINLAVKLKEIGLREELGSAGRWKLGTLGVNVWNTESGLSAVPSRFTRDAFATPKIMAIIPEAKVRMAHPALMLAFRLEQIAQLSGDALLRSDAMNDASALLASRGELHFDLKLAATPIKVFVQKTLATLKPKSDFNQALRHYLGDHEARVAKAMQQINDLVRIDLA